MATMAAAALIRAPPSSLHHPEGLWIRLCGRFWYSKGEHGMARSLIFLRRRRIRFGGVSVSAINQDAEKSFKKTVEVDRLIDLLKVADAKELDQLVVENVLAFNEAFWIRLAARTDTCRSDDDKKDYEELAASVMTIVDRLVHKTNERIGSATDVLKAILNPVVNGDEEISWPPRDPEALILMEKELEKKEQEGLLDEGFLSEVNAQLRQAKEDGDKPGLEAMLQKVLQVYASKILAKRSYANKGEKTRNCYLFIMKSYVWFSNCSISAGGKVLIAEKFLEAVIQAPENQWNKLLIDGLSVGKGEVPAEEFYTVIKKRIERVLIRTEGGSYEQRILVEYLRGIQSRTEEIVRALQGPPP
ncbi:uncharacterized protein LOC121976382 isoform X1 [Zingiber officinale]|uniref:uncharacterized protein LOC121976382 isoform X1 n=1 Tax=Zingiber officinale TaxID=94328 RepID=UPI001C4C6AFE|nr:uncharacterized protein LOC121976382 isoform X1 [Zingiber officinale]